MTRPEDIELDSHTDAIAQLIRQIDGKHDLGAAALAEALVSHGVGVTSKTVLTVCLVLVQLSASDYAAGKVKTADALLDAAQHIAGLSGVNLSLDLAGMTQQQREAQQRLAQQAKTQKQQQPSPVLKRKSKRGKARGGTK